MRIVDSDTWERREIYQFFSRLSQPFYMVTFQVDVTPLHQYVKAHGLSFYKGMIWACTEALNQVEAFRMTIREGQLCVLDQRHPSFTDLKPGAECFHVVTASHKRDIGEFCAEAERLSREQRVFMVETKETDDLIYYTCLPWVELTALTNERDLSSPDALDDNIPRIAWGRYTKEGDRVKLALSLEVNHRFIDGIHIGQFAEALEKRMASL